MRCAIVASRFNELVTTKLVAGAREEFLRHGVAQENIDEVWVPGAWELPLAAQELAKLKRYNGFVCIGIIIKGETEHYRHIARAAVSGISKVALDFSLPIGNCILACNSMNDALERAGGKMGNRGAPAARAVLEMIGLQNKLNEIKGKGKGRKDSL